MNPTIIDSCRGLDFPAVDWVIQVDCPESTDTYIHRVGRTARYDLPGNALLLLLNSEKAFLDKLATKRIPITETRVNPAKLQENGDRVAKNLAAYCSQDAELKYLAQKSFVSYVRSVFLQKDKTVFNVDELPLEEFAHALGLAGTPKIKFVKKKVKEQHVAPEDPESSTVFLFRVSYFRNNQQVKLNVCSRRRTRAFYQNITKSSQKLVAGH
jgi:ATP-dependent RNA helicase DDX10/DBP4